MVHRRAFLAATTAFIVRGAAPMTSKDRVNLVLQGKTPDRAPFSFWHHFHDEKLPGIKHASATLDYQRKFRLDLVKVMSDYPYPKGSGKQWYELKEVQSPFPEQLSALELIRDGLAGQKYFVETVFNPWNQATKLSTKEEVQRLMHEKPQALLDALEVIAKSQANHAKAALEAGAAGIFLAIDNAQAGILTPSEYRKFSEPFDRMILAAAQGVPLNTLHLHGERVHLDLFWKGWPASVIQYSAHGTKVPLAEARKKYAGVLMGGLDEESVVTGTKEEALAEYARAKAAAPKWICAPGCSVPDDSTDANQLRLSKVLMSA